MENIYYTAQRLALETQKFFTQDEEFEHLSSIATFFIFLTCKNLNCSYFMKSKSLLRRERMVLL